MKGTHHTFALTTKVDEITGDMVPGFSFPIQVCKATESSNSVSFDLAGPSGAKYATQYVDEGTGEVFEYGDRLRGVRVGDEFTPIDPDAIKAIDEATKLPVMFALGKLDLDDALAQYGDRVCGVHFVQNPKDGSPKAYRLTYEALREKRSGKKVVEKAKALVTKRTATSRQKLGLLYADETRKCLMLLEVQFSDSMRSTDDQIVAPQTIEVPDEQIELARTAIGELPDGALVMENEVDEAIALRQELVEKAIAGEAIVVPAGVGKTHTSDDAITAALEASIGAKS